MTLSKLSLYTLLIGFSLSTNTFFASDDSSNRIIGLKTAIVLTGVSFYLYKKYGNNLDYANCKEAIKKEISNGLSNINILCKSKHIFNLIPKKDIPASSNRFEESLRNEHIQKRDAVLKQYFSKEEQKDVITLIDQAKKFNKENVYKKCTVNVNHDNSLSQNIIELTKQYLRKYGINPSCINIKVLDENFSCSAQASSGLLEYVIPYNEKYFSKIKVQEAPTIYLKRSLRNDSVAYQHHIISHEVTHLVEQHGTESGIILMLLKEKKGLEASSIEKTNEWKEYIEAIEKCADLLPCTHDKGLAEKVFTVLEMQCLNNPIAANQKKTEHPTRWSQYQWMKEYIQTV